MAGDNQQELIQPIQWIEKILPLTSLKPFERNPRVITEAQFNKLKQSILEDGYHARIKVTHDFRVVGGHQRLKALRELQFDNVPVLVPSRPLSDLEFTRILLRDNHSNGTFDIEMLANDFDLEFLRDMGLHEVMNIPPMPGDDEEDGKKPKSMICCPKCGEVFPAKGNKAN